MEGPLVNVAAGIVNNPVGRRVWGAVNATPARDCPRSNWCATDTGLRVGARCAGGRDHVKVWPKFQRQFSALLDTDYIAVPRGRVLYHEAEHKFIVFLDHKIATPKVTAASWKANAFATFCAFDRAPAF